MIPISFNFIDTTDVQDVLAVARNYSADNYTFTVSCNFIHGSDAKGCIVVLVGNVENATINLTRSGLSAEGILSVKFSIAKDCAKLKLFGYDVESDGNIGTVGIRGKCMLMNESI